MEEKKKYRMLRISVLAFFAIFALIFSIIILIVLDAPIGLRIAFVFGIFLLSFFTLRVLNYILLQFEDDNLN